MKLIKIFFIVLTYIASLVLLSYLTYPDNKIFPEWALLAVIVGGIIWVVGGLIIMVTSIENILK
jgi:uncharacterized membrane protein